MAKLLITLALAGNQASFRRRSAWRGTRAQELPIGHSFDVPGRSSATVGLNVIEDLQVGRFKSYGGEKLTTRTRRAGASWPTKSRTGSNS